MKLTRGCVYALRALEYVASRGDGGPVTARHIAEERGLPGDFLSKALQPLVRAGLLRSEKGPNGGFRLARPASRISLLEVVEAVDGPVRGDVPLVGDDQGGLGPRLAAVCERVADLVRRRLGAVRLADLAGKT
jgi:Rrf2 family protein